MREHLDPLLDREFGLELRDYLVLNTVHWGVRYPTEIAEALKITKDMASRAIQKLLQTGLLERSIDKEDSRRTRLELTSQGLTTRDAIRSQLERAIEGSLTSLSEQESERLLGSLEAVSHHIKTNLGDLHVDHH